MEFLYEGRPTKLAIGDTVTVRANFPADTAELRFERKGKPVARENFPTLPIQAYNMLGVESTLSVIALCCGMQLDDKIPADRDGNKVYSFR